MPTNAPKAIQEAVRRLRGARVLPSTLSSNELAGIATDVRKQAIFSAKVAKTETLGRIRRLVQDVVEGKRKPEEAREALEKYVKRGRYVAPEGKEGTIEDLGSEARTRLIIQTNVGLARGYGRKLAAQENIGRRPFWELYRQSPRMIPRDWRLRWRLAGGRVRRQRFVAPINDGIWTRLSRFGTPYPPFDFNSGMGVRSLTTSQGAEVGVKRPANPGTFEPSVMAPVRKATLMVEDADMRAALLGSLNEYGDDYRITREGVLTQA